MIICFLLEIVGLLTMNLMYCLLNANMLYCFEALFYIKKKKRLPHFGVVLPCLFFLL